MQPRLLAIIILDVTQLTTYQSENIVEWTFAFLLNMYFSGMILSGVIIAITCLNNHMIKRQINTD